MSVNKFYPITEDSFINQHNIENTLLASIVQKEINNQSASYTPNSWSNINSMIDLGIAKTNIYIGDQFVCNRGNTEIVWDTIGHNCEQLTDSKYTGRDNMTLYMHNLFPDEMQFGARQAFYATDTGLTAGVYNIFIESQPWYTADQNKYAQFELLQDLPAGGQIVFTHGNTTTMFGKTLRTYSSCNSTTAIETAIISEGDNGTNLGALKDVLQDSINTVHRSFWGSSNYKESAIRQWLNSKATAGNVWKSQTKFDRPPSWAATANGFMYGMDEDFLSVVKTTHIKVARNIVSEGGGVDEMDDKFFLLSTPQIYGGLTVSGVDEGQIYPYFANSFAATRGASSDLERFVNFTCDIFSPILF